jgi:hypothetical protein
MKVKGVKSIAVQLTLDQNAIFCPRPASFAIIPVVPYQYPTHSPV